ncbi:hypothetical protein KFE80_06950 [bacterium SCSIO 12696]|nr:hypothetical protein KFE80_06950 [bacterium SCSIO 12696]
MRIYLLFTKFFMLVAFLAVSGCISNQNSYKFPDAKFDANSKIFVVKNPDDKKDLSEILAESFRARGFSVELGSIQGVPEYSDVLVEYDVQWWWDVGWYITDFQVTLLDLHSDNLLLYASSNRSSLARKSPRYVVDEVVAKVMEEFDD